MMCRLARPVRYSLLALILAAVLGVPDASAMSCGLAGSPRLVFGAYDPLVGGAVDVQANLTVECTPTFPGEALDITVRLADPLSFPLAMQHAGSGESLVFGLFRDPAHIQPLDGQNLLSLQTTLRAPISLSIPLFGRIPAGLDAAVGDYRLGLTILLDY